MSGSIHSAEGAEPSDLRKLYDHFSANDYLRHFYSGEEPPHDEQCILRWLVETLRRGGRRYHRAIEVGCGPTLHHALPLVPYVEQLSLVDYSTENLAKVEQFRLQPDMDSSTWRPSARLVLRQEGMQATSTEIDQRFEQLRRCIHSVQPFDLLELPNRLLRHQHDLVTAFFVLENVSDCKTTFARALSHFTDLCAPGGTILIVSAIGSTGYEFNGSRFASARLTKSDFEEQLPLFGFPPKSNRIEEIQVNGWEAEGIARIALVVATKSLCEKGADPLR